MKHLMGELKKQRLSYIVDWDIHSVGFCYVVFFCKDTIHAFYVSGNDTAQLLKQACLIVHEYNQQLMTTTQQVRHA